MDGQERCAGDRSSAAAGGPTARAAEISTLKQETGVDLPVVMLLKWSTNRNGWSGNLPVPTPEAV